MNKAERDWEEGFLAGVAAAKEALVDRFIDTWPPFKSDESLEELLDVINELEIQIPNVQR